MAKLQFTPVNKTLIDGRNVEVFRRPTARDYVNAEKVVENQHSQTQIKFALLASCLRIDGVAATYEDVLDIDELDIVLLSSAIESLASNFTQPAGK